MPTRCWLIWSDHSVRCAASHGPALKAEACGEGVTRSTPLPLGSRAQKSVSEIPRPITIAAISATAQIACALASAGDSLSRITTSSA
jgi:hypothetical protein